MPAKVLFVGLDGAEPELLEIWSSQGELPNIKQLMDGWFRTPLDTPRGFGDGVFWSTLFTGCNAGRHGHYFPWQFDPLSYGTATFSFDDHYRRDPFWMYASKMGRRVGIIDIYSSPLVQGLDGIQVMDWMIHDRTSVPRSWPDAIIGTLHERYMEDPLGGNSETDTPRTEAEWVAFHRGMLERIPAKTRAVCDLVRSNPWDLFAVGFCDAHDAGHQSWHWHDRDSVDHPAEWRERHGDPLLQIYQGLDRALGEIVDAANADAVFVVAGIGMGPQTTCNPVFDQVLGHFSGHGHDRLALRNLRPVRPYFDVPHNMNSGALRINLKGRERNGVVNEEDYDSVCDDLIERLGELTDADTGTPVINEVVRIRREYSGPFTDQLPDLMVVWQRDRAVRQVRVPGLGVLDVKPAVAVESRSGDHTPNALFLSDTAYEAVGSMATVSVAPTLGRALGITLPGVDGAPLRLATRMSATRTVPLAG